MKEHIQILSDVTGASIDILGHGRMLTVSQALEAMRLAVEQANGWVSVETPPEVYSTCFVYTTDGDTAIAILLPQNGGQWQLEDRTDINITHWSPLLAPPIK